MILLWFMQNFKTIGWLQQVLWTNEILWGLSLKCVAVGYPILKHTLSSWGSPTTSCSLSPWASAALQWVSRCGRGGVQLGVLTRTRTSQAGRGQPGQLAVLRPFCNIKMLSYQYGKCHCGDKMIFWSSYLLIILSKMIIRSSYLHNGIFHTGKTASLYWIMAQFSWWFQQ